MSSESVGLSSPAVSFLSTDLTSHIYGNCAGLILDSLGFRILISFIVQLKSTA